MSDELKEIMSRDVVALMIAAGAIKVDDELWCNASPAKVPIPEWSVHKWLRVVKIDPPDQNATYEVVDEFGSRRWIGNQRIIGWRRKL